METINESSETAENPSANNDPELSVNVSLLVQEQMDKVPTITVTEDGVAKAKGNYKKAKNGDSGKRANTFKMHFQCRKSLVFQTIYLLMKMTKMKT